LLHFRSCTQVPRCSIALQGELARAFFWRMKANGHIIIIITSYQEFPGTIVNPFDDRHTTPGDKTIHAAVDGYLHCFRSALHQDYCLEVSCDALCQLPGSSKALCPSPLAMRTSYGFSHMGKVPNNLCSKLPGHLKILEICRDPDTILPPGVPRMLLSESDFHDPDRRDGGRPLSL